MTQSRDGSIVLSIASEMKTSDPFDGDDLSA
jgi:hypothetical protein